MNRKRRSGLTIPIAPAAPTPGGKAGINSAPW